MKDRGRPIEIRGAMLQLTTRGYIPAADPAGDEAARAAWNARFDELAARPPTHEEMIDRIRGILAEPRPRPTCWDPAPRFEDPPVIPGTDPRTRTARAWIPIQDLIVTRHTDFPYHASVERLAELAVETSQDRDRAERLTEQLFVTQVSRPGGSAFWIAENGNHRALTFRALDLPLVLARIRPQGTWWEVDTRHALPAFWPSGWPPRTLAGPPYRTHPILLEILVDDGLITECRPPDGRRHDVSFLTESAVPWVVQGNLNKIPALLKGYEAKFGRLADPRYDWLRSTHRMRRRMWAHAWPELQAAALAALRRDPRQAIGVVAFAVLMLVLLLK